MNPESLLPKDAAEAPPGQVHQFRLPTLPSIAEAPCLRCRTAFLSDTHLGFEGARAGELAA
ncbi:MAG: hypothetical protein AAF725_07980, partial [Acidobacteriota bacterium]